MLKIAPLAVRGALTLLLSPVILALPLQHPNVLVQGTVLDAGTGAAILDGTARATRGDEGLAWQAPIRDGHFTLELPAGEGYLLTVWAAGFHHHEFRGLTVLEGMPGLESPCRKSSRWKAA